MIILFFYFIIFCCFFNFSLKKHFIILLLRLELILITIFIFLINKNLFLLAIILLSLGACEGALGLSLLIMLSSIKNKFFINSFFISKMLKSLMICLSTCLAFNFPVESLSILFIFILLNYNMRGFFYQNTLIDHLNCNLVTLSFFIIVLCILTNSKLSFLKKYLICNLILLLFLITSFISKNLIFFFILFEASLIPLFFLILGWGYQPERLQSSIYFLFYTYLGHYLS